MKDRDLKQIEVPRDMHEKIKALAREQGRKIYAVAAEIVAAGLARRRAAK